MSLRYVYPSFLLFILSLSILLVGSTPLNDLFEGAYLRFQGNAIWNPLLDERLPRLIVILCTGASLAVAGSVVQALFQNPLASPSILGISLGGSLAVFIVFFLGWHLVYPFSLPAAAFLGSLITLGAVWGMSTRSLRGQTEQLILTGLALSTFLVALQGALVYIFRDRWSMIQLWIEWEAGSTFDRSWQHVHLQLPLTLIGLIGCYCYRHEINLLSFGDEEAGALGVDVKKVRFRLFLFVAMLTAGSLAACGLIPFFGLVLPHVCRRFFGADHEILMPQLMMMGGVFLGCMDQTLRLFSLHMVSIGQISALLGGLFFLAQVVRPASIFWGERSC